MGAVVGGGGCTAVAVTAGGTVVAVTAATGLPPWLAAAVCVANWLNIPMVSVPGVPGTGNPPSITVAVGPVGAFEAGRLHAASTSTRITIIITREKRRMSIVRLLL
jgi:hypothetical protein